MLATAGRSIKSAIDEAQQLCQPPTGRALAERLGMHEQTLSNCRSGSRKLTKEQVERLAEVLDVDPISLWQQQAAEDWLRSKGQRGLADVAALLVAFLGAALLAGASGLMQSQPVKKPSKEGDNSMHIVALCRQMALRFAGAIMARVGVPQLLALMTRRAGLA